jgi:hypothetical protein
MNRAQRTRDQDLEMVMAITKTMMVTTETAEIME